jgi:hypothetical protein
MSASRGGPRVVPLSAPLLAAAAVYTAGAGYVHLREWLDLYRNLPSSVPGSAVVRIGFPVHAVVSGLLAVTLLVGARRGGRLVRYAVGGSLVFQAAALAALVVSRTGSLFGWREVTWTGGAGEALLAAIGAMVTLSAAISVAAVERRRPAVRTAL